MDEPRNPDALLMEARAVLEMWNDVIHADGLLGDIDSYLQSLNSIPSKEGAGITKYIEAFSCMRSVGSPYKSEGALYVDYPSFKEIAGEWGQVRLNPTSVRDGLPSASDLHPEEGWAWFCTPKGEWVDRLPPDSHSSFHSGSGNFPYTHWLPYHAIPYIRTESP